MPDITMCRNSACPDKENCYRWTANPNPRWQSYSFFEGPAGDQPCRHFAKNTEKSSVCHRGPRDLNADHLVLR